MRTDGLEWTSIAKKLEIREQSLQRWVAKFEETEPRRAKIKPVEIVVDRPPRGIMRSDLIFAPKACTLHMACSAN